MDLRNRERWYLPAWANMYVGGGHQFCFIDSHWGSTCLKCGRRSGDDTVCLPIPSNQLQILCDTRKIPNPFKPPLPPIR